MWLAVSGGTSNGSVLGRGDCDLLTCHVGSVFDLGSQCETFFFSISNTFDPQWAHVDRSCVCRQNQWAHVNRRGADSDLGFFVQGAKKNSFVIQAAVTCAQTCCHPCCRRAEQRTQTLLRILRFIIDGAPQRLLNASAGPPTKSGS